MKKFMWIVCALFLSVGAVGCGKNKNKGTPAAVQQNCTPNTWTQQGYCNAQGQLQGNTGNQYPGNPYPGTNYPVPGNGNYQVQCPSGQLRLQNRCYYGGDLVSACRAAGGQVGNIQGATVCRTERRIVGFSVLRSTPCSETQSNSWITVRTSSRRTYQSSNGEFGIKESGRKDRCVSYAMNANVNPSETLRIAGTVSPKYSDSNWSLLLKKGYTVMSSAYNGSILNEGGDNFVMTMPAGAVGSMAVPTGIASNSFMPTMGYPGSSMPGYSSYGQNEPVILEAQLNGDNVVRFRMSATSCEDGNGNHYTCD